MQQVAIVGLSPTSHDDAPWDDPEWEIWGLPWDPGYWRRYDRHFEMHDWSLAQSRGLEYIDNLMECPRLYMQERYVPNATKYPLEDVIDTIGRDYFNSSPAYMFALALHECVDRIGLWGVDLAIDTEYAYQRPNMEWLIGLAEGQGVDVVIPNSALMTFNGDIPFNGVPQQYVGRYGWL